MRLCELLEKWLEEQKEFKEAVKRDFCTIHVMPTHHGCLIVSGALWVGSVHRGYVEYSHHATIDDETVLIWRDKEVLLALESASPTFFDELKLALDRGKDEALRTGTRMGLSA